MQTYQIRPLPLSIIEVDMSTITYRFNLGRKVRGPIYTWYIEGADKHILVDTGADATEYPGVAEGISTFENALAGIGLKPEDIDIVIQTHLHRDHSANTLKCKNAKVVVQENELRFAYAPHPIVAHSYKRSLFKGLNFRVVRGQCEIAPGIELIPTPGHTPGGQSVSVNTSKGKAIITGFCCFKENFGPPEGASEEVKEMMPVIPPGNHLNAVDGFESVLLVKGLADIVIPCHDPAFEKVKSIP